MNKENVMFGIIGLLIGVVLAGFAAGQAVNNNHGGMMRMMGMDTSKIQQDATDHSTMSMAEMSNQLESLSGDAYDKAFIEMMIDHHEGAVDMALLSSTRAKHDEVKELSRAIVSAQEKEISDMKKWQQDWGYSVDEMMYMMHGNH